LLTYHGGNAGVGVTTGSPRVYLVFWGSQWGTSTTDANGHVTLSADAAGMAPRLQAMYAGIGTNGETWSGVMTQYCEGVSAGATSCPSAAAHVAYPSNVVLAGVWADGAVAAPSQATGTQLASEAQSAAAHFGNTTQASNRNAQYVVVSPQGTHPDGFNTPSGQFCAWHDYSGDYLTSPYGPFAFTNLPYVTDLGPSCGANYVNAGGAGSLDGVTIVSGHEYAETLTDQFPGQTDGGWWDAAGYENADKCAWNGVGGTGGAQDVGFSTGSFAMQATFSNDSSSCLISHRVVGTVTDDFTMSAAPSSMSIVQGGSMTTSVATALSSGSAETIALSATGVPAGASASFSPGSVSSGGTSTLTVHAGTAAPGAYTVTITGTGSSITHTASLSLTITPSDDFSISASPASLSIAQGGSAKTVVSTQTTAGSAQSVALSAAGAPSSTTTTFTPSSVTSGASATLGIGVGLSTPVGVYTLTVTGAGASATHATNVILNVTLPGGGGIANGGFETGDLSGWTPAGTTGVLPPAHTGAYAARLGSTAPTNGDSTITQTFSTPSGSSRTLTVWYQIHCPDTVHYDWATVTLRDNTAKHSATLLGRTCTNTGAWLKVSASVAAGHSFTLTLLSHDDDYASDPTYVQYDDIAVS
jgi:serine protease